MKHETHTKDLLTKVSSDISKLKDDISTLFSYTRKNTLPHAARELRDYGRDRLHTGGDYAASGLKYLRQNPGPSSVGLLGGLVLLGAVGTGIYYLLKSDCCHRQRDQLADEEQNENLPSYIS